MPTTGRASSGGGPSGRPTGVETHGGLTVTPAAAWLSGKTGKSQPGSKSGAPATSFEPRRARMSQEERNALFFGPGRAANMLNAKGGNGVGSSTVTGGRGLGLGGRLKQATGSGGTGRSATKRAGGDDMGMATWNWARVKAHMEAATNYPRPMVGLCRKNDGRRWPSEEFPAEMEMGQVFKNRDDLAAVLEPPPEVVAARKGAKPSSAGAKQEEEESAGRQLMMLKLKEKIDQLAAEKQAASEKERLAATKVQTMGPEPATPEGDKMGENRGRSLEHSQPDTGNTSSACTNGPVGSSPPPDKEATATTSDKSLNVEPRLEPLFTDPRHAAATVLETATSLGVDTAPANPVTPPTAPSPGLKAEEPRKPMTGCHEPFAGSVRGTVTPCPIRNQHSTQHVRGSAVEEGDESLPAVIHADTVIRDVTHSAAGDADKEAELRVEEVQDEGDKDEESEMEKGEAKRNSDGGSSAATVTNSVRPARHAIRGSTADDQSTTSPGGPGLSASYGRRTADGEGEGTTADADEGGQIEESIHSREGDGTREAGVNASHAPSSSAASDSVHYSVERHARAGVYDSGGKPTSSAQARVGIARTDFQDANQKVEGFDRQHDAAPTTRAAYGVSDAASDFGDRIDGNGNAINDVDTTEAEDEDSTSDEDSNEDRETTATAPSDEKDEPVANEQVSSVTTPAASVLLGKAPMKITGDVEGSSESLPPSADTKATEEGGEVPAETEVRDKDCAALHRPPRPHSSRRSYVRSYADDGSDGESTGGGEDDGVQTGDGDHGGEVDAAAAAAAAHAAGLPFVAPTAAPPPRLQETNALDAPGMRRHLAAGIPPKGGDENDEAGDLQGGSGSGRSRPRSSTPNSEKALVLGSNHELAPLTTAVAGIKWKGLRGGRKSQPGATSMTAAGGVSVVRTPRSSLTGAVNAAAGTGAEDGAGQPRGRTSVVAKR